MRLLATLAALLLASCGVDSPARISQLDRMKTAQGSTQNASEVIDCHDAASVCGQMHLLKGDACYGLATKTRPAPRAQLTCAANEIADGLSAMPDETTPVGTKQGFARKRLEALHGLIDTRGAGDPSGADDLIAAAAAFAAQYPNDPAGPYYEASGMLTRAQDGFLQSGDKPSLCAALTPIDALYRKGSGSLGKFAANFDQLSKSATEMSHEGGC